LGSEPASWLGCAAIGLLGEYQRPEAALSGTFDGGIDMDHKEKNFNGNTRGVAPPSRPLAEVVAAIRVP
jgi:hypothetical protein